MASWTPISPWKLGTAQTVAISGTSAQSTAMGTEVRAVLIVTTSDCHILIGQNPTATTSHTLIKAAYPPLVFGISPGDKVAVIQDAAGGTLYVTPLDH